jgi:hypothetical protein
VKCRADELAYKPDTTALLEGLIALTRVLGNGELDRSSTASTVQASYPGTDLVASVSEGDTGRLFDKQMELAFLDGCLGSYSHVKAGKAPSCCIREKRFATPQCSVIFPSHTRMTSTVSKWINRPIRATPRNDPSCVP